ncbi:MAG TPA: hypothetical protein VHB79_06920 [Polyangiaceae bacterium]|nr:hypothetical protein [Polyangiaceae bacterium]
MAHWTRLVLPLCAAPLLGSCYFLLDYQDLQSDQGKIAATSGGGEGGDASTSAGSGGESDVAAGGASACGDCDDHDPCTVDSCDAGGSAPQCVNTVQQGLALDGVDETHAADQHIRVSLVGSGQLFYLAEMELNKDTPKVALYRLGTDDTALKAIGTDLALEGNPVSNVGLAVEELAAGEVALHGFVATKLRVAAATPRVFHVVNRNGQTTSNLIGASYRDDAATSVTARTRAFPQALTINNKVVGAWIQADGTIAVHNVGTAKTETFGAANLGASTLSLLSTADDMPAVMFTAQTAADSGAQGTYVETSGQNRTRVPECETRPGAYLSSAAIATQIPGLWLANITRYGTDYLGNGNASLVCGTGACTVVPEDCKQATLGNAVRDVSGASVHFDNDKAGVVYLVLASPQVVPPQGGATAFEARLNLGLGRVDFSVKDDKGTPVGDPQVIASNDTTEATGFAGPDWPAVAILPSQKVAVAWIQPNSDFSGTELRVQRYKMCLPPP